MHPTTNSPGFLPKHGSLGSRDGRPGTKPGVQLSTVSTARPPASGFRSPKRCALPQKELQVVGSVGTPWLCGHCLNCWDWASNSRLDCCCSHRRHWDFKFAALSVGKKSLPHRVTDGLARLRRLRSQRRSPAHRSRGHMVKTWSGSATRQSCGTCRNVGASKPALRNALLLCSAVLRRKKFGPAGSPTSIEPCARIAAYSAPKPMACYGTSQTENVTRPPAAGPQHPKGLTKGQVWIW